MGYAAPNGAEIHFGFGDYNYAAPDGAGDGATIAQPFMAGYRVNKMKKSREGRQKNRATVGNGGRAQAPFVPGGTLDDSGIESQP
jgi:hypothetical protein